MTIRVGVLDHGNDAEHHVARLSIATVQGEAASRACQREIIPDRKPDEADFSEAKGAYVFGSRALRRCRNHSSIR